MWWHFVPLLFLVACSASLSASETAFFNLSATQRQQLIAGSGRRARFIADLLRKPDQLLVTLLLANLTVNIAYFAYTSVLLLELSHRIPQSVAVVLGAVPLLALIILGEVTPKIVALSHSVGFARLMAVPIWAIDRALMPIGWILNTIFAKPAVRLLSPRTAGARAGTVSHDELAGALEASAREGLIDRQTSSLLAEVVRLQGVWVREVMVPRVDMKAFDLSRPREQFMQIVRETGLKRLPACDGDLDHIVGLIDARAALTATDKPLRSLVRKIAFVPDVISVAHLLSEFRRTGQQIAVVVDEYGGTAGLVTLEDLVEEVVGDIYDPRDRPTEPLRRIGPDEYVVAGDLPIRDWADIFQLDDRPQPVHTIAGLIATLLGRVPRTGDVAHLRNLTFTVEDAQRHRVRWARVRREPGDDNGDGDAEARP